MNVRRQRITIYVITWIAYAAFYLCRKPFSVAKSTLALDFHLDLKELGAIDTGYLTAYAVGQFVSGLLCDRIGARRLLALGLVSTAAANIFFGLGSVASIFLIAFTLNGFTQSTGWPTTVKAMTTWFDAKERGRVMGHWSTCYQVGGIAATALATFLLAHFGWRSSFIVPALLLGGYGVYIWFFMPEQENEEIVHNKSHGSRAVLRDWRVWNLGAAYFCIKLIRYSLLFWLPFYLNEALGYSVKDAGYLSISFEVGGVLGAIVGGAISDRFVERRGWLMVAMTVLLSGSFLLFVRVNAFGPVAAFTSMMLIGFLLFGPDALLGVCAQDVGGAKGAGTAAGVVNGVGSVGAILQGFVTPLLAGKSWNALYFAFGIAAFACAVLLSPFLVQRTAKPDGSGLSNA